MGKTTDHLWTRMRQFWRRKRDGLSLDTSDTSSHAPAAFVLQYRRVTVGVLTFDGHEWKFCYSDAFKDSSLRPITEFPDIHKEYKSTELWPFFLMRIPSLRRAFIKETAAQQHIDPKDEARLLEHFGRRTIANPFELILVEPGTESCAVH